MTVGERSMTPDPAEVKHLIKRLREDRLMNPDYPTRIEAASALEALLAENGRMPAHQPKPSGRIERAARAVADAICKIDDPAGRARWIDMMWTSCIWLAEPAVRATLVEEAMMPNLDREKLRAAAQEAVGLADEYGFPDEAAAWRNCLTLLDALDAAEKLASEAEQSVNAMRAESERLTRERDAAEGGGAPVGR